MPEYKKPIIFGLATIVGICIAVYFIFGEQIAATIERTKIQQQIVERSGVYNRKQQQLLSEHVKFERTSVGENTIRFHYTLLSQKRRDTDLNALSQDLATQMVTDLCESSGMQFFRAHNVRVIYDYRDANNEQLSYIELQAGRDCRKSDPLEAL